MIDVFFTIRHRFTRQIITTALFPRICLLLLLLFITIR